MRSLFLKRDRSSSVLSSPELKNPERELYYFRRRLTIAAALILLVFAGLLGRFVDLQVIQHRHYQTLAESNRIAIVPIVPNRGVITDRNGVVLARSYSAYTLEVTPSRVRNLDETIDGLAGLVDIQPRDRKRFKRLLEESKNLESVPLRNRLSDEEVARFAVNRYRFPGVEIKARLFRQYPFGEMASHVIGYIGRINDRDVDRIEEWRETANYKGSDYIGKSGLELSYERELHGTTGVEEVEVDAAGRAVRTLSRTLPTSGNNLKLSLDIRLQQAAETAFGTHRGAMVALDPATGEVLAFVSKPGFDPNLFVDGIDPASWDALNDSPDKPLLNRPLRGAYPPGSTIKPFLALSALTSGKRTATQVIFDPGYYQLAGSTHRFRDDKPEGHGYVDMTKSIIVSCDTYYYMLAGETDIDVTHDFLAQFGFGSKTGVDIEGELPGVLPSREWKRERFSGKNYREEQRKWYLGDSISAGIGQGYNAFTPMQQAEAIATIANDGVSIQPHLVKIIEDIKTGAVREMPSRVSHIVVVKPEDLALVKNALVGVPREGTSARAFVGAQYVSAGKTGTAQLFSLKGEKYQPGHLDERLRDHAWYLAYAPADHPSIALAVLVENGGFGAQAAAPIARAVFDYYLLGRPPAGMPPESPRVTDDESD
ncbi:MAG TPA: penicillin-binding protein 2 [Casimicrobiaceae bacterium]|jgi:penicillin-binding protein 2|nr:penicillin-binding protein 2 [Casimicrobiaceae bacterium]